MAERRIGIAKHLGCANGAWRMAVTAAVAAALAIVDMRVKRAALEQRGFVLPLVRRYSMRATSPLAYQHNKRCGA